MLYVHQLRNETYFARLRLRPPADSDGQSIYVDCRPSDGLALASRDQNIAIHVAEDLLQPCA